MDNIFTVTLPDGTAIAVAAAQDAASAKAVTARMLSVEADDWSYTSIDLVTRAPTEGELNLFRPMQGRWGGDVKLAAVRLH